MSSTNRISRQQLSMMSLDCLISSDNAVRVIDLFVDQLPLQELGFKKIKAHHEGRPPYEAKDMLKLYYYGYLNRVRSSRKLEAECIRNTELWWLLHQLTPAYHTIANFRKDNPEALKKAFKMFVGFLRGEDMFDGKLIAVDGTKVRAQNNKKNTFNEKKLIKSLEYIDSKVEEYIRELEQCDAQEDRQATELKKKDVTKKLEQLNERKEDYKQLQDQLGSSSEKQISLADGDSRSLPIKDGITDVCYNIQTAADSKHSLIVEFETINATDQGQLSNMTGKTMEALGAREITVLADKGYHTGKDLQECRDKHITTIVAYPERHNKNIDAAHQTNQFIYNSGQDSYTCPKGAILTTNGKEYLKSNKGWANYFVKKYQTVQCSDCPFKQLCTTSTARIIERSEYQDAVNENNKRVDENPALYKKRPQIIEHLFGTIKRSWGYTYTLLKGMKKVNGEVAIIFTMYNFRRAISILGVNELMNRLKEWKPVNKCQKKTILFYGLLLNPQRQLLAA